MVQQYDATNGLPSGKENERRRQRRFQLSSVTTSSHQLISSSRSTRARNLLIALCDSGLSTPRIAFANKTQKKTLNVLLLLEKTRIRNVRRTSKHFPTTKIDFLTIKVVLRITRTITVFRNATDDFRTESKRLAYGSRPYMQFPDFGEGALCAPVRSNFKPPYVGYG